MPRPTSSPMKKVQGISPMMSRYSKATVTPRSATAMRASKKSPTISRCKRGLPPTNAAVSGRPGLDATVEL